MKRSVDASAKLDKTVDIVLIFSKSEQTFQQRTAVLRNALYTSGDFKNISGELRMSLFRHISVGLARTALAAAFLSLVAPFNFAQSAAPSASPAAPQTAATQPACPQLPDTAIPLNTTIQAKVTTLMQASHLKPGKDFWVNAAYGMVFPGCSFQADAAIYGHVLAASSSKNPNASELALELDRVDCSGHDKQKMKLFLIGVVAPKESGGALHNDVPTEVKGGSRQISDTAGAIGGDYDAKLNPGGAPHTIKPGVVVGFKNLKLEPQGGPQCSARLSSTDRNIELAPGAMLILAPSLPQ